jgi:hypothetical protein
MDLLGDVINQAMTLSNVLSLLAMFLAPLVALQVSRFLDRTREKRDRRLSIFRTLMATRKQVGPRQVEALNLIDVEFGHRSSRDRRVVDAWKVYLDHLNRPPTQEGWGPRTDELFTDLLFVMAQSLGYDFDKVHLRNQAYHPTLLGDLENDNLAIRKGLVSLLKGEASLHVQAVDPGITHGLVAKTAPEVQALNAVETSGRERTD